MKRILSIFIALVFLATQNVQAGYRIWLGWGQSNMTGFSDFYFVYTGPAIVFGNDYLPHPLSTYTNWDSSSGQVDAVSSDGSGAKESWIRVLAYYADLAYPGDTNIFVPCSFGGTHISAWQPGANVFDRTTMFGSMDFRAVYVVTNYVQTTLGGTVTSMASIGQIGETDSADSTSTASFLNGITNVTQALYDNSGYETFIVRIQNGNYNQTGYTQVTNAIHQSLGKCHVIGEIVFPFTADGPDTIHISSLSQQDQAATNAIAAITSWFIPPPPPAPRYVGALR